VRKVSKDAAQERIRETLLSIRTDILNGKIKKDSGHEFHEAADVGDRYKGIGALTEADLANLVEARLRAQGYILLFDEALARETLDAAMARLEGLFRRQS
jgi:hypothetical protein